jgi:hypothetical protein
MGTIIYVHIHIETYENNVLSRSVIHIMIYENNIFLMLSSSGGPLATKRGLCMGILWEYYGNTMGRTAWMSLEDECARQKQIKTYETNKISVVYLYLSWRSSNKNN